MVAGILNRIDGRLRAKSNIHYRIYCILSPYIATYECYVTLYECCIAIFDQLILAYIALQYVPCTLYLPCRRNSHVLRGLTQHRNGHRLHPRLLRAVFRSWKFNGHLEVVGCLHTYVHTYIRTYSPM